MGRCALEQLSRKDILKKSLENYGYILIADDMDSAVDSGQ